MADSSGTKSHSHKLTDFNFDDIDDSMRVPFEWLGQAGRCYYN